MTVIADVPSGGMLFGLPAGILCVVVLLAGFWWCRRWMSENQRDYDYGPMRLAKWASLALAVAAALITAASMWPFKHDYHWWVDKGGVVTSVSKRLVPAGDNGMQEKYVFTIDGKAYGVVDTRASLVKPGQRVKIKCKKAWEWGTPYSAHGWDCKWNGPAEMEMSR